MRLASGRMTGDPEVPKRVLYPGWRRFIQNPEDRAHSVLETGIGLLASTEDGSRCCHRPCLFTDTLRRNRTPNSVPMRLRYAVSRFVLIKLSL